MAALEPMLPQVARPAFANASPVLGLCNGLARWGEDVILAFDRVEALRGSAESALTSLARDLPPNVHLALASRVEPGLPRSLLVGSDVLRVDHEMLALNKDEGRELALLLDPDCDESLLTTILTDAEGWPAGLSLAARSVRKGRPPTIDGEPLTAYLAATVDDDQPPEVQRFLVATSVLDSFTPELAEAVSGEENAGAIIAGLLTNHHFTVPVPEEDGRYRYLHLVAAFLRRRLERTDPTHLAELHHRAGAAFAARGAPADAVPHYLAAGSVEEAADALDQIAHEIAGGPRAEALVGWLDTIPRELWWARPGLVLAHASLLFGEGRYEEAWDALEQALQTLLERGEQERAAVAFLRLLQVALADGTPERGLEAADHWLARLDPESGLVPAAGISLAHCHAWALQRQPPEVQRFLVATSVLDSFTPELAEAVSGEENAGAIIAGLLTNHHFTVPVPEEDGRYRYLHLVAAFLRRRLERTDPTHLAELHHRAGAAFAARGAPADAVPHYLAAGSVEEAADALDQIAHEIAGGPRAEALVGWLDTIPRELWWARPGLVLAHASLLFGEGRYEEAWDALEQALQTLLERGEQERAAVAFLRLLQVALADGTPERGLEAADHWLARLDPESGLVPAVRVARAACAAWARGPRGLDRQFEVDPEAGQGPIPAVPLFAIASRAYFIDHLAGRSASALSTIETVIAALETYEHADDPLAYLFTVHTYRAFLLAHLGRWEEALGALEPWERMAERRAMGNVARRLAPWVRLPALAGLGRWQELEAEFVVLPIPRPATAYWTRYHAIAAQLAAHAGDAARVEAHASHVATPQSFFEAMACCDMAVSAWTVGLGNVAAALAERAREGSEACGADLARARAALIQAAVRGPSSGDELLEEALDLSAQLGLEELWARRERAFAGPLLAHALCARVGEPRVAARLAVACGGDVLTAVADAIERAPTAARAEFATALGDASVCEGAILRRLASDRHTIVRAAAESTRARLAARPRAPLAIVSFGTFAVSRAGRPLNDPALRRAKPRALLTALLCARGPAHRDQLLEWLWPDLDPDRARASLHTTLSALRRALEDGRAGPGGGVIVTDGESYRMALREDDDWDAERFLRLARNAERAGALEARNSRLLAAETARSAPFLPEWPYEEWARATRGAIDRAHETVLESLGDAFVEVGQPEAAVSRYARLLELDPERERWHRALMRAYAAAQERGLAVRQFHLCRQLLRERLGVVPGEETQALFRTLL